NPPTQAGSGEKVTVTAFITNMGENLAEKSTVQFYMDDQLLCTKNISKLKPGKNKKIKVKLNVPAISGSSILKVELTPTSTDIGICNNSVKNQMNIFLPDLTVKSAAAKGDLVPGKSGTLTVKVANSTIATAGKSVVRVYRVNGGTVLGEKKLSKLKTQEKDLNIRIKVPADFQAGETLRIVIDADSVITEANETNNELLYP
ncbi:MAG: CARDB domain-containing protein, partial [Chitinophagales bacterium]